MPDCHDGSVEVSSPFRRVFHRIVLRAANAMRRFADRAVIATGAGGAKKARKTPTFDPDQASLSEEELELLRELVERANQIAGPIVEIGTLLGRTTTRIALWKAPNKKFVTVDNYCWNPWGLTQAAHRAVTAQVLYYLAETGQVDVVVADKAEFFANYRGAPPAMLFLDAWHTYDETKKDIEWAKDVGAKIICGHDYAPEFPGVMQVVDEMGGPILLRGSLWALPRESDGPACS